MGVWMQLPSSMVQVKGFFIVDLGSGMIDKPMWALVETKR